MRHDRDILYVSPGAPNLKMNTTTPRPTMEVLRNFGFRPSDKPDYGFEESLMYDFGNFKLYADLGVNRWFRRRVMFGGNFFTPRTMAMIEFEMPCEVESQQLCAALIAYHLRGNDIRPV